MSNQLMIDGHKVNVALKGNHVVLTDYFSNNEVHFKHRIRKHPLRHLVIHETAGASAKNCKHTLYLKGYGVHLIIDRDGHLSCHGDLLRDVMIHANQLNATSIGIEVVNPYAPRFCNGVENYRYRGAEYWTWCPDKQDRRYVLPTRRQIDVLRRIVPLLCNKLQIPYIFPTQYLNSKIRKIKNWRLRAKPDSGIVAHGDFSRHADGRYPLECLMADAGLRPSIT